MQGFSKDYVVEVGEDDTTATMRQKVASAEGLCEDSFHMGFGGKDEGEDITQLEPGATITLTKTTKYEAITALHALGERDLTAERLQQVRDPKVASLLLQAEVATAIPDNFCRLVDSGLTRIVFSCVSDVDDNCGTTLHLPALPSVTTSGYNFLYGSRMLQTADLSGLQAVTTIGDNFLSSCPGLSTVDLSGMKAVTTIGDYFLSGCDMLSVVDLSGLRAVTTIGDLFLYRCTRLSTVDLTGLQAVTTIGDRFLSGCEMLSTVDLSGLRAVTTLGLCFLASCPALQIVDGKGKCSHVVRSLVGDTG